MKEQLRLVIAGHVDHGKSTLIGRLLYETNSLPQGKREEIEAICKNRRTDEMEWSFLLDAFQEERNQAITIDTTQVRLTTPKRDYIMIDVPGHKEFLKNMISGASLADAAILMIDAEEGLREQTRRHAYLLSLLGITQIIVVVNKMDRIRYDEKIFKSISAEIKAYLRSLQAQPLKIIPVSARHGEMIRERGKNLGWYKGKSLLEIMAALKNEKGAELPLRFSVQDVYHRDNKRIIAGRVESGKFEKGQKVLFSPTDAQAMIASIEIWPNDPAKIEATAGETIGITLHESIFVERGYVAAPAENLPMLSDVFRARIFWLTQKPLQVGNIYKMRLGTHETEITVQSIEHVIDMQDLANRPDQSEIKNGEVAEITLRTRKLIPLDSYADNARTGKFVIYESGNVVGGGHVDMKDYPDQRFAVRPKSENITMTHHFLSPESRAQVKDHRGGIFWLTGLSGAGKSTIAMAVERALHEKGYHPYVLDGDNIRHGLNADLGFSPQDRTENIRRVAEVAALMADAGLIVITAFISPYRADREKARAAAPEIFHEIHVLADLPTCEARDPKGLYRKARAGEIGEFTGINSPYETPISPDLVIDTQRNNLAFCGAQVLNYIEQSVTLEEIDVREYRLKLASV